MENKSSHTIETSLSDYFVFASIIAGIVLISLIIYYFTALGSPASNLMRIFMGVFFLIFGAFKLFNLKGFAESYTSYDVIAAKYKTYAYVYPFLELLLALGYFYNVPKINIATLLLMAIGSYGIAKQLLRGNKIKCACLGNLVNLPLSTVSLVEDVAMGVMALMLIFSK